MGTAESINGNNNGDDDHHHNSSNMQAAENRREKDIHGELGSSGYSAHERGVFPSPLQGVLWWRMCLDEAQKVQEVLFEQLVCMRRSLMMSD